MKGTTKMLKVEQMKSNKGNKIVNQYIIKSDNVIYLQSYNSIIVKKN